MIPKQGGNNGGDRSPLVLLVNDEEWTARSLDALLRPNGYAVLLAYTGEQGLDLARTIRADCILVDHGLPDMTGADLTGRLREIPTVRESTPLLVISTRTLPRPERLSCLRNGAWDVLKLPFDTEEFLIRMEHYIGAKRDVDRALEVGHVDPTTGLYNALGLTTRLTEILADAVRHDHPLACVALGLVGPSAEARRGFESRPSESAAGEDDGPEAESLEHAGRADAIGRAIASVTRVSDIVARVGSDDFVVVAPSTNQQGGRRLADRLFEALRGEPSKIGLTAGDDLGLRAGYHALDHPASRDLRPEDVLTRATRALRQAQSDERGDWIRGFDHSQAN